MPTPLVLAVLAAISGPVPCPPAALLPTQEPDRAAAAPKDEPEAAVEPLPPGIAAVAEGLAPVRIAELEETLLWRHALTQPGRAALRQLLEVRVLEALAAEQGIVVSPAALNARYAELDKEARQAGQAGGLEEFLAESGVPREKFREFLRLSIVHERLTRRALGLGPDDEVSNEQQQAWLDGILQQRPYVEHPFPYTDGVVASSGDVPVPRADYVTHLRSQIEDELLQETAYLMLLERAVRKRMPDLSDEGLAKALDQELVRRRAEAESDPRYHGVTYEQLLEAKGLSLEAVRRDPAIRSAALAHWFVDRAHDDAALRKVYEDERDWFDGLFGPGVDARALLLNAAQRPNELVRRSFEEADTRLTEIKRTIETPADFERLVQELSEDRATRERGGRIGIVTRGNPQLPALLRDAVFEHLAAHEGEVAGAVLGPIRLQGGSVLIMLGERRPAPTWEGMREHVHNELRRRFLEDSLPRRSVRTAFD
jgi:parvulin-like peptidyl-prolyl isomerase